MHMQNSVYIAPVPTYPELTTGILYRGLEKFPNAHNCKGKTVLLKPNLVEYSQDKPINTDPVFLSRVIELFRDLGAARIIVGEGPGHRRDTRHLLNETGIARVLWEKKVEVFDLNLEHIAAIPNQGGFTAMTHIYTGGLAAGIDMIVSLPKLKTHHFTGLTCSLKNLMGMTAGAVYGWPKNIFHKQGLDKSIADLYLSLKPQFSIVDGITAMSGNGPLHGETVPMGIVVMAENLVSIDATCAAMIGLDPLKIGYLKLLAKKGFTIDNQTIPQIGADPKPLKKEFPLLPTMEIFK
jgi:uncharacterized protein (DUF362 family)